MFSIYPSLFRCTAVCFVATSLLAGQDSGSPAKPLEHLIGSIANADASGHTVTLKEDGAGTEHVIHLDNAKTLLKVAPGAKDLKTATRIQATDLSPGDRIDVRGSKVEGEANAIAARSVVLMSGRDLQQVHQEEAAAWRRSTSGTVAAIDQSNGTLTVNARTPSGVQPIAVTTATATFTRYSPEHPKNQNPSKFSDIQPGDQVRILGEKSEDGKTITAQKIYSGTFKTIAATVSSIAPDGKSMTVRDLATKQPVTVSLNDDSSLRRLPPMMATVLARRLNPDLKAASDSGSQAGAPGTQRPEARSDRAETQTSGANPPQRNPQVSGGGGWDRSNAPGGGAASGGFRGGRGNGDLSQMLDRLPPVTVSDLKIGDAVIVSGSLSPNDKTVLLANSVVAGVEPILRSASPRQAQSLGDWNSLGAGPGAESSGQPQ